MSELKKIPPPCFSELSVVILAGGQGKRVGARQKALLPHQGKPLLHWVLQCLPKKELPILLNVNSEDLAYKTYDLPLFPDEYQGFLGPLAGMQAAWKWVALDWIVFVPCDNPSLPIDLMERLIQGYSIDPAPLVVAYDGQRVQPLYLLMHRSMALNLKRALEKSHLSVSRWIQENPHTRVDFSDQPQAFQNINTLESS
ncbi:MAG: molybdenum cofactor guanylyltransferase [Thiomicrorhabdus sp.]|nr:molybdenum cofactor guanylyltransferase [Thiomicrorhabdus sp.]